MITLNGRIVRLRLAKEDDAAFIWSLRSSPALNAHLSPTAGGADAQRAWLRNYKKREREGQEFYFIAERHDHVPCGAVRLYDLTDDSFEFGSFVLSQSKPHLAALEVAVLAFSFGFDVLNRGIGRLEVRRENIHATQFYLRFGAREVGSNEIDCYFEISKFEFETRRVAFDKIIAAEQV